MIVYLLIILFFAGVLGFVVGFGLGAALARKPDARKAGWIVAGLCVACSVLVGVSLASSMSEQGPGIGIIHFFSFVYVTPIIAGLLGLGLGCCLSAGCFSTKTGSDNARTVQGS